MRSRADIAVVAFCAALTAACATAPAGDRAATEAPVRSSRNVISTADIQASTHSNPLELIYSIRPGWLTHRGQESMALGQGVDVYVDGIRQDRTALAQIPLSQVARLEFLSPSEATFRFGTQEGSGAILVTTRRR